MPLFSESGESFRLNLNWRPIAGPELPSTSKQLTRSLFELYLPMACCLLIVWLSTRSGASYPISGYRLGPPLQSIGAQSTAGTARLLVDYPQPQRDEILDLLFKPSYGASLQHLKVEIGGDAQISCGIEASPMRAPPGSTENDFNRGYEHWLMSEARRRSPSIELLALVYAWPAWINPNGTTPYANARTEQNAADYVTGWLDGVKASHNLTIDWVGIWNEQSYTISYIETLRKTLDAGGHTATKIVASDRNWEPIASDYLNNAALRSSVDALTQHYPHCNATTGKPGAENPCSHDKHSSNVNALRAHSQYGVLLATTEDYSCWTDSLGAGVWAQEINSQYIGGNITMVSAWHLISSFYSTVAFWNEGLMNAVQPWSGHYTVSPTIWATAHTTQFTRRGMRYLPQGFGSGALVSGGTFVSFYDPAEKDLSIVIETSGPGIATFCAHNCNGACAFNAASVSQNVTFTLADIGLKNDATTLVMWRTRLGLNISDAHVFAHLPDVEIQSGAVTIVVEPDAIYTLSTIRKATKAGGRNRRIPPSAAFTLPYSDTFESSLPPQLGKYWSGMSSGAFEVALSNTTAENLVLRQSVVKRACCNFIEKLDGPLPLSIIGSSSWVNIGASISVAIPDERSFALFGVRTKFRARSFFQGGLGKPSGIFIAIDGHGWQVLPSIEVAANGLNWPPLPASGCLANGSFPEAGSGVWRSLQLTAMNRTLRYSIDGAPAQELALPPTIATGSGFVSIASSYSAVEFDNFTVQQVLEASTLVPASRCDTKAAEGQQLVIVGCGEPAANAGARWDMPNASKGIAGAIVLRSNFSLCLSRVEPLATASEEVKWNATAFGAPTSPPTPPPTPPGAATRVVLAACAAGDSLQQWLFDTQRGSIAAPHGGGLTMGSDDAGSFAPVTYTSKPTVVYWSPDLGYIHSSSNNPMACNCVAVCGSSSFLER